MFDLEKFKTGKYYVHLPTQELFNKAMRFLESNNIQWTSGVVGTKNLDYWDDYEENTYIRYGENGITYGDVTWTPEEHHIKLEIDNHKELSDIKSEEKLYERKRKMKLEDFIKKHGNVNVDEKELKELLGIKDEKYFMPEEDERYFVVDFQGEIFGENNNSDYDKKIFENNEVFKTKEEAEEHAKKQRFLLQMKRDFLDNSDEIDWEDDNQAKYHIYYNYNFSSTKINATWKHQFNVPVTTNRDWLEEYIKRHEEELKKYYFEIEEI